MHVCHLSQRQLSRAGTTQSQWHQRLRRRCIPTTPQTGRAGRLHIDLAPVLHLFVQMTLLFQGLHLAPVWETPEHRKVELKRFQYWGLPSKGELVHSKRYLTRKDPEGLIEAQSSGACQKQQNYRTDVCSVTPTTKGQGQPQHSGANTTRCKPVMGGKHGA
jgi:hypothetical protein